MRTTMPALGLIAVVFVGGCNQGKTVDLPSPVAASGKVTLASGEAIKDVRIYFEPIEAMAPASAEVKAGGAFSLQTYDNKPGACPGKYRVIFRINQGDTNADYARSQAALKSIPTKYTQDDSPLTVEVPSGGKTDFAFKLDAR